MPAEDRVLLEEGQEAPEIVATVTGGGAFRLSEHRGRWVVIYFYPRANTPG
jgi:peroxiredoxin Q/BCP